MALVKVEFDGGDVPVVTGEEPDSEDQPIKDPVDTGGMTNTPFLIDAGIFTFSLDTDIDFKPLWQTVQTLEGQTVTLNFKKLRPRRRKVA